MNARYSNCLVVSGVCKMVINKKFFLNLLWIMLASILVSMNYTRGLVKMFSFIIMLATLTTLVPYVISSLVEIVLYLRKKKKYQENQLYMAIFISIPAFLYSIWAVSGLGISGIFWGIILLLIGIPIYFYIRIGSKKK